MSSLPARFAGLVERHPELEPVTAQLDAAFDLLVRTFAGGGTVYVGGNGGSAADADHIVGELMKGMERRRPVPAGIRSALVAAAPPDFAEDAAYLADRLELALPAVSLTSQTGLLTAVANDTARRYGDRAAGARLRSSWRHILGAVDVGTISKHGARCHRGKGGGCGSARPHG